MEDLTKGWDLFISRVAAGEPLPGGGCAAAAAGSLAAALGEMIGGLTLGRSKFASVQDSVVELHSKLTACRQELLGLVQEDAKAYEGLLQTMRMPAETGTQRSLREDARQKAVREATMTPIRTARTVLTVLQCLQTLVEIGNPNARCDAGVGAQLGYASLKGVQYNVLANARLLQDRIFAESCSAEVAELVRRGEEILRAIDGQIRDSLRDASKDSGASGK